MLLLTAGPGTATPVIPGAASADEDSGSSAVPWTMDEAERAVRADVISRVGDAPARVDADVIRNALAGTDIRVVLLPFTPLDDPGRSDAGTQRIDLKSWADDEGYRLIAVQGLSVTFDIFVATPDSLGSLSRLLAQSNVTDQVLFAISHILEQEEPPDEPEPPRSAPPGELVDRVGDALAADGLYNDPALDTPQKPTSRWQDSGGTAVRAAFFPPVGVGEDLPDLITPLHERFPDDIVVVGYGRWLDVAGPDEAMTRSAVLWTYGYYLRGVLNWEVQPAALVGLFAERYGLLSTGVTHDEPTPEAPRDPVSSVSDALPWIFGGTAVALVIGGTAYVAFGQWRRRRQTASAERAHAADRHALGARLAAVAGQIVAIEPLVGEQRADGGSDGGRRSDGDSAGSDGGGAGGNGGRGGSAATDLGIALERYRVARTLLRRDRSFDKAAQALEESERRLAAVSRAVGVPLAAGAEGGAP